MSCLEIETETQEALDALPSQIEVTVPEGGDLFDTLRAAYPGRYITEACGPIWIGNTSSRSSYKGAYYKVVDVRGTTFTLALRRA